MHLGTDRGTDRDGPTLCRSNRTNCRSNVTKCRSKFPPVDRHFVGLKVTERRLLSPSSRTSRAVRGRSDNSSAAGVDGALRSSRRLRAARGTAPRCASSGLARAPANDRCSDAHCTPSRNARRMRARRGPDYPTTSESRSSARSARRSRAGNSSSGSSAPPSFANIGGSHFSPSAEVAQGPCDARPFSYPRIQSRAAGIPDPVLLSAACAPHAASITFTSRRYTPSPTSSSGSSASSLSPAGLSSPVSSSSKSSSSSSMSSAPRSPVSAGRAVTAAS